MSKIIPNSFQTPNAYIDEFMALLTPEEYVVLSYTARRIFGFQKEADRISLSQYSEGLTATDGTQLDHGTGLNKKTVRRALDALLKYGLMIEVEAYDSATSTPACYSLQIESDKVDRRGLEQRQRERHAKDSARTIKGRAAAHPVPSDNPPPTAVQNTPVLSDTPPPVRATQHPPLYPTTQQKPEEKQSRKPSRKIKLHSAAGATAREGGSKPKPEKDERTQHAAIQAVRRMMSRYPDKVFYDDLIEILGDEPDMKKLAACRKVWVGKGWNSNSLDWIYWYRDGIPQKYLSASTPAEYGEKPPETPKPTKRELPQDEIEEMVKLVVDRISHGESIEQINAQLAETLTQYDCRKVLALARAQLPPEQTAPTPVAPPQVIEMASRMRMPSG